MKHSQHTHQQKRKQHTTQEIQTKPLEEITEYGQETQDLHDDKTYNVDNDLYNVILEKEEIEDQFINRLVINIPIELKYKIYKNWVNLNWKKLCETLFIKMKTLEKTKYGAAIYNRFFNQIPIIFTQRKSLIDRVFIFKDNEEFFHSPPKEIFFLYFEYFEHVLNMSFAVFNEKLYLLNNDFFKVDMRMINKEINLEDIKTINIFGDHKAPIYRYFYDNFETIEFFDNVQLKKCLYIYNTVYKKIKQIDTIHDRYIFLYEFFKILFTRIYFK